jgi:UDP-N-acetylglucosamine 1-carboxyvinyltransferase
MEALRIKGGKPLRGVIEVSGAKNASLPVIAACLLAHDIHILDNVPNLADVHTLLALLTLLGAKAHWEGGHRLFLDTRQIDSYEAPYELVRQMRASILVLGPLLARYGQARVSLPGGCSIGARPIDQHLRGLAALGAHIVMEHGDVVASAPQGLRGATIYLDNPTVTGTENLMLAATLAEGETILINAAREPEIEDLAVALGSMGACIDGAGTDTIRIRGRSALHRCCHRIIGDRIECGTWIILGALLGDELIVEGGNLRHQQALLDKLSQVGVAYRVENDMRICVRKALEPCSVDIDTAPYPGFPTDMQAQMLALLSVCKGTSMVHETIFENRFMHVPELNRLGANIHVDGSYARVRGVAGFQGTTVTATDLRASACLVLAGLAANGETILRHLYHLDRGYERLDSKLTRVGAHVERFTEVG